MTLKNYTRSYLTKSIKNVNKPVLRIELLQFIFIQVATERFGRILGTSFTYQYKKCISAYVRKYLTLELWLKEFIYNKCSKYPPWDSMHASTRPIMDATSVQRCRAVAVSLTGIHSAMCLFIVYRSCIHKGLIMFPHVCSVSFIVCVVLCAVFCLSVVCYFVWCVLFVCCVLS
jgi:hypothetical protein